MRGKGRALMPRKQLPIRQRHRDDCTRPRDCACPWSFRVRLPDGTMPRVTRDSYEDARAAYYELMARRPEPLTDRATTIAQWAERWQAAGRGPSGEWRPGSRAGIAQSVRKHIVPDLGHIAVTELRRDDVSRWVSVMRARGTGPVAMKNAVAYLHSMYAAWLKSDRILPRGNPVDLRLTPKQPRKDFPPLTRAQVAAWAAAAYPEMRLMIEIEAFYGARMSEVCALREDDILFTGIRAGEPLGPQLARLAELPEDRYDARRPRLRFERKMERDGSAGPIKNARGNRKVPLPQWLAAALAEQFEKWPPAGGWLFVNRWDSGGAGGYRGGHHPAAPGRLHPYEHTHYGSLLSDAAKRAGIALLRGQCTHALRHHCVSVLRDKGWSDQAIGYWIGDAAATVATIYGRPMPDALDRISAQLSEERTAGTRLRAVD